MKRAFKKLFLRIFLIESFAYCVFSPSYGMEIKKVAEGDKTKGIRKWKIKSYGGPDISSLPSIERKINNKHQIKFTECREGIEQLEQSYNSLNVQVIDLWVESAKAGDLTCLYHLGRLVDRKEETKQAFSKNDKHYSLVLEKAKAVYWWTRAQNQKDTEAQFKIGSMYVWGLGVGKDFKKAFEWFHKVPTKIRNDTFSSCDFTDEEAPQVAALLARASPQNKICLKSNKFTSHGLTHILKSINSHTNLDALDLRNNLIDDEGGKALLSFIKEIKSLKNISLDNNNINIEIQRSIDGVMALRKSPSNVSSMTFSLCNFTDEDAPSVATLLAQATHLRSISLTYNKFTSHGVTPILKSLSAHQNLVELRLNYNSIDDKGGKEILTFFEFHPSLKKLSISDNSMSKETENLIENMNRNKK